MGYCALSTYRNHISMYRRGGYCIFLLTWCFFLGVGECRQVQERKSLQPAFPSFDLNDVNFGLQYSNSLHRDQRKRNIRRRNLKSSKKSRSYRGGDNEFVDEDFVREFEDMFGPFISHDSSYKSGKKSKGSKKGTSVYHMTGEDMSMHMSFSLSMTYIPQPSKKTKSDKGTKGSKSEKKSSKRSSSFKEEFKLTRAPESPSEDENDEFEPTAAPIVEASAAPTTLTPGGTSTAPTVANQTESPSVVPIPSQPDSEAPTSGTNTTDPIDTEFPTISPTEDANNSTVVPTAGNQTDIDLDNVVTPVTIRSDDIEIMIPSFSIIYRLQANTTPLRGHYVELTKMTDDYLGDIFHVLPGISPLHGWKTDFDTSFVSTSGSITVRYKSVASFESSENLPDQILLDEIVTQAFTGKGRMEYITRLQELRGSNVFSSTIAIHFDEEVQQQQNVSDSSSSSSSRGIIIGATLGVLALLLSFICIRRGRMFTTESLEKKDGTVAGMTYTSATVAETTTSNTSYSQDYETQREDTQSVNVLRESPRYTRKKWTGTDPRVSSMDESLYNNDDACTYASNEETGKTDDISLRATTSFESTSMSVRFALNSFDRAWREDEIDAMSKRSVDSQPTTEDGKSRRKRYPWESSQWKTVPKDDLSTHSESLAERPLAHSLSLSFSQDIKRDLEKVGLLYDEETAWEEQKESVAEDLRIRYDRRTNSLIDDCETETCDLQLHDDEISDSTCDDEVLISQTDSITLSSGYEREIDESRSTKKMEAAIYTDQNAREDHPSHSRVGFQSKAHVIRDKASPRQNYKIQVENETSDTEARQRHFEALHSQREYGDAYFTQKTITQADAEQIRQSARCLLQAVDEIESKSRRGNGGTIESQRNNNTNASRDGGLQRTIFDKDTQQEYTTRNALRNANCTRESFSNDQPKKPSRLGTTPNCPYKGENSISQRSLVERQHSASTVEHSREGDTKAIEYLNNEIKSKGTMQTQPQEFIAPWREGGEDSFAGDFHSTSRSEPSVAPEEMDHEHSTDEFNEKARSYGMARSMHRLHPKNDEPWWHSDERSVTRRNKSSFRRAHYSCKDDYHNEEDESEATSKSSTSHAESSSRSEYLHSILPR